MKQLSSRILSSIENHGRCAFSGLCELYPQESNEDVRASVLELVELGWLKLTYKRIDDGPLKRKTVESNVSRTSKQYYTQPDLF